MPVTYVYKIPLFRAYEYSLVREGAPRPDQLDEEGILHQILTRDADGRLVKIETCVNGEITVEKCLSYTNGRLTRETESFLDSGGATKTLYRSRDDGYVKECYIDNTLDMREEFVRRGDGPVTAYRKFDAGGETVESWEADEHGNVILALSGGEEVRTEYTYDDAGRITRRRTRAGGAEQVEDYRYDPDGHVIEEVNREVGGELRIRRRYERGELVREEYFDCDVCLRTVTFRTESGGAIRIREETGRDDLWRESIEETDPRERFRVLRERSRTPLYDGRGSFLRHHIAASAVEELRDAEGRLTDVLTCDASHQVPELGLSFDPNAYYFLEYEAE